MSRNLHGVPNDLQALTDIQTSTYCNICITACKDNTNQITGLMNLNYYDRLERLLNVLTLQLRPLSELICYGVTK